MPEPSSIEPVPDSPGKGSDVLGTGYKEDLLLNTEYLFLKSRIFKILAQIRP